MKHSYFVILVSIMLSSCSEKIADLPNNVMSGSEPLEIVVTSIEFFPNTSQQKDLRLEYNSLAILTELNVEQSAKVTGYIMYKNGAMRAEWDLDRTWFYDAFLTSGSEYCYEIALRTMEGPSKKSEMVCVVIP